MTVINIYDVRDIDDDKIIPSGDVLTGPLILTLSLKQTVAKIVHLNTCQINKRVQFLGSLGVIEHRLREEGHVRVFVSLRHRTKNARRADDVK